MMLHDNTDSIEERNGPAAETSLERRIIAAIRTVFDPEIAVNVYDLGVI